jgi:hypothetical protein
MRKRSILAVVALVVTACGGGVPEAAGQADTIAVHGDWTIDIYNPDGSLDQHIEFENGLHPNNDLASLIAGDFASAGMAIRLSTDPGTSPCYLAPLAACQIYEGEEPLGQYYFPGLSVTTENGVLNLDGSFTALNDGQINRVESLIVPDGAPVSGLTLTTIDPIQVAEGQTVQVEVVISFTTG